MQKIYATLKELVKDVTDHSPTYKRALGNFLEWGEGNETLSELAVHATAAVGESLHGVIYRKGDLTMIVDVVWFQIEQFSSGDFIARIYRISEWETRTKLIDDYGDLSALTDRWI